MSEDESRKFDHEEEKDEVEAHRRVLQANEEPAAANDAAETDDDDVEAHRRRLV